jgi:myosin heavy chain 9/10/11/14
VSKSKLCNRELLKEKSDTLEFDLRQAKEQLAEMTRTATEYSNMIDQKEAALERMGAELDASKEERERMARRVIELQGEIDTLAGELEAQKSDRIRGAAARERLQSELDDLRATLREKDSEDTRKDEAAKSMEVELVELRTQSRKLQQDISDARRQALESNNKLKVELESAQREHASVQRSYDSLLVKEREASSKLIKTEAALSEAEKARRTLESELHVIRSRQVDMDRHLEETQRAKEVNDTVFPLKVGF